MTILNGKYFIMTAVLLVSAAVGAGGENARQPELWFPIGERLTYKVYWGIFPVAETRVTNHLFEEEEGEEKRILLSIQVVTRSYALLDTIYPVDDFLEKVAREGGKVVHPKMAIPGVGYHAYCQDSEGNTFGLMQDDPSAK